MEKTQTILVLVGSGEFTPAMNATDRQLLQSTKAKTVAILPTAAGQEPDYHKWIDDGVAHFQRLGATPVGVPAITKADAEKQSYIDLVRGARYVYFSGGYPGYLFDVLDGSALWKTITQRYQAGVILAGASAGAMIMGSYVLTNGQEVFMEGAYPPVWDPAFGLVDYAIFPHFDRARTEMASVFAKVMTVAPKHVLRKWMGIDEDTALIVTDGQDAQVVGRGTVHVVDNGQESTYKTGDHFILR